MEHNDGSVTGPAGTTIPGNASPSTAVIVTERPPDLRELRARLRPSERTKRFVDDAVRITLDTADRLGDAIAEELGIRRRAEPPAPGPTPPAA